MAIQNKAIDNHEALTSKTVHPEYKHKIRQIRELKKYFYDYFERESTSIYNKTAFLGQPAATYLVIVSPFNEIKAEKHCFPIVGCFPYLGFFKKKSAEAFLKQQENLGKITYMRPVYAYSTLGHFDDPILSSFFVYQDFELAEMIFHELFHTIFFIKDEVELNENLANFFGKYLAYEYFQLRDSQIQSRRERAQKYSALSGKIVELAQQLQQLYKERAELDQEKADELLQIFLKKSFFPQIKSTCEKLAVSQKNCFPLHREWNNASFAAYLTYEKKADQLSRIYASQGKNLKNFLSFFEQRYIEYQAASDDKKSFSDYVFSTLKK